jgi:putative nucleotidyltransferase with HDIG domain/PAS domain S-box-containing protein
MDMTAASQAEVLARQASLNDIRLRRRKIGAEIAIILAGAVAIAVAVWVLEYRLAVLDTVTALGLPVLDETILTVAWLCLASATFSYRRLLEAQAEARARQKVEADLRVLQSELESRVQARTAELLTANQALQIEVDEHQHAEASLQQSEEFNHRLVAASPIGILYLDSETRITFENPVMRRMMGVPEGVLSPVIGQKLLDLPPVRTALSESGARAILAGEAINAEVIHYRSLMGLETDLEVHTAPLRAGPSQREGTILLLVDVTTRVRAQADLNQRLAELEALSRISTALRTAQTLEDMLPLLIDETLSILGGSAGSIWLYDPASDQVRMAIQRGRGSAMPGSFRRGEGIPGHVVATGQPYLSRELRSDPRVSEGARGLLPAGRGGVCVPIRAAAEIIGALSINTQLPHEFTAADTHLLTTLAEIAGNAIHRTRLHQQTEHRLQQLTALSDIDRVIASGVDLRLSLTTLLVQLSKQLEVDAADVLVYNHSSQTLEYAAGQGFRTGAFEHAKLRLGEGAAGRAALEGLTVHIPNLGLLPDNPRLARALVGEAFVGYYGVPLVAKGKIQGVLEVFQRAALEPDHEWLDFLNTLAGQAALAIDNAGLFDSLQRSNTQLAMAYDATIEGWSRALDLRDKETEGHSQRVTDLTMQLAQRMGINDEELVHMRRGALLHDIGKMGVPDGILLKPGALTADEWVIMRQHPAFAYELLYPIHYLRPALDIPYCHHEKWDGSGYPRGLKGEQIPRSARIFAVVDVWDALRSDRPYRPAWPVEKVRLHIREQSGQHFDPVVVEAFLGLETGAGQPLPSNPLPLVLAGARPVAV